MKHHLGATRVTLGSDAVDIVWSDGHHSRYPHRYLRGQCTCARCQHEWTGARLVVEADLPTATRAVQAQPVGRYGLRVIWQDGHSAGIYTFEHLRRICACPACLEASG